MNHSWIFLKGSEKYNFNSIFILFLQIVIGRFFTSQAFQFFHSTAGLQVPENSANPRKSQVIVRELCREGEKQTLIHHNFRELFAQNSLEKSENSEIQRKVITEVLN